MKNVKFTLMFFIMLCVGALWSCGGGGEDKDDDDDPDVEMPGIYVELEGSWKLSYIKPDDKEYTEYIEYITFEDGRLYGKYKESDGNYSKFSGNYTLNSGDLTAYITWTDKPDNQTDVWRFMVDAIDRNQMELVSMTMKIVMVFERDEDEWDEPLITPGNILIGKWGLLEIQPDTNEYIDLISFTATFETNGLYKKGDQYESFHGFYRLDGEEVSLFIAWDNDADEKVEEWYASIHTESYDFITLIIDNHTATYKRK